MHICARNKTWTCWTCMVLIQQIGKQGQAKEVPFVHPPHSNLGSQLDMEIWDASWGQRHLGERQKLLFVRFTGYSFDAPPAPLTEFHRPQGCGGTRNGTRPRRCPISKPQGWSAWTETPLPRGQPFRVETGRRLGGLGTCYTAPSMSRAWMNLQWHPEGHLPTHWPSPRPRASIPSNQVPGIWTTTPHTPESFFPRP